MVLVSQTRVEIGVGRFVEARYDRVKDRISIIVESEGSLQGPIVVKGPEIGALMGCLSMLTRSPDSKQVFNEDDTSPEKSHGEGE